MAEEKDKIIIEVDEEEFLEQKQKKPGIGVLCFTLGGENYCVATEKAREAVRLVRLSRVPNTPEFVTGVMNLRGTVLSIIDIRCFFGLGQAAKPEQAKVVVVSGKYGEVGVLVDEIKGNLELEEEEIQPALATIKGELAEYTRGEVRLGKEILIFLDIEKILDCEAIKRLREGIM